ncbi:MAG TPA: SRPBCC family protein [Ignavibacteria bacterium]|jgi:activator of HSP90 ATPase
MKTKNLKQSIRIKAKPSEVYSALMDSRKHAKFSGSPAKISKKVGGKFTAFEGYLDGENLELDENRKIVQRWHAKGWPEGHYSKVTFSLKPFSGGTKLLFFHTGIPEEHYESIKKGWVEHYWDPIKKMLEKS